MSPIDDTPLRYIAALKPPTREKKPMKKANPDKEAVKLLYMELGPTEAARRLSIPIGTVTKWASRYGWVCKNPKPAGRPHKHTVADLSQLGVTPSEALEQSHKNIATETRTQLAAATLRAARNAAAAEIPVAATSHLKDLAAAAARVFGWDQQQRSGDTYNTCVITQEQLAMIRSLHRASLKPGDIGYVSQQGERRHGDAQPERPT
jgi:hypothetical protein